jgi:hypothetical protein
MCVANEQGPEQHARGLAVLAFFFPLFRNSEVRIRKNSEGMRIPTVQRCLHRRALQLKNYFVHDKGF